MANIRLFKYNGLNGPIGEIRKSKCKKECFARKYHMTLSSGDANLKPADKFVKRLLSTLSPKPSLKLSKTKLTNRYSLPLCI